MSRVLLALAVAGSLAGCMPLNTSPNTLQVSGAVADFPVNYLQIAAKAVQDRPIAGPLLVSYPRQLVGETPFSPKRWYLCIRGLEGPAAPAAQSGLLPRLFADPAAHPITPGIYEAILLLDGAANPSIHLTFDAELCREGTYEPLPVPTA